MALYSYGLYSYGLYSYCLYSYGLRHQVGRDSYLFDLPGVTDGRISQQAEVKFVVDAYSGGVARFLNHECGGEMLLAQIVFADASTIPRICFFAARDIEPGTELVFDYRHNYIGP